MGEARKGLEGYFNRLWYGGHRPAAGWRALSHVYRVLVDSRSPVTRKTPVPVIVVGNITAGGGGKTPVVAALTELLRNAGFSPAVISRGYGGRVASKPVLVAVDADPAVSGDEPLLLARKTGCPVWVCRRRTAALDAALDQGADVVVSDDGLQHRALARSFEICVIDAARGFGNGRLLPAGPLREPIERLETVDLVLRKRTAGSGETVCLPGLDFDLCGNELIGTGREPFHTVDALDGRTVDAVCGIANPESFFSMLEALRLDIRRHAYPDHHEFTQADLAMLPGPLVVTEKDWVKLERLDNLPETWVLPVRAQLPQAATAAILSHVREFDQP